MDYSNPQFTKGLKSADLEIFELLYKEYYVLLCIIAERIVRNPEDAEEVVSDVFIKLWNNKDSIHTINSLKAYLIKAVQNTAINYLHRHDYKHITERIDQLSLELLTWDDDYLLGQLYEKEIGIILNREINSLPKGCREIFLLSRDEELSYKEIAQRLGITVNTVKSQMKVALSRLREILQDYLHIILIMMGL
jgi:RNA polymerase sigma-70 factor (ECF subfamily)